MNPRDKGNNGSFLPDQTQNEEKRRQALRERCAGYRSLLCRRDPQEVARLAAMSYDPGRGGRPALGGEHLLETYTIWWPELEIVDASGRPAGLEKELLWLHYLERADGFPLTGRWVNLSEIGGLFYQQAFQGYSGDELAAAWGENTGGLQRNCTATGGWPVPGMGDLAFEWRVLPRFPIRICYRLPVGTKPAWATVLFDAATAHYAAADVAAIAGKELVDRLKAGSEDNPRHAG